MNSNKFDYFLFVFIKDIYVYELYEDDNIYIIEDFFFIGSQCFMLVLLYYGVLGEVIEIDVKQFRVRVQF